MLKAHLLAIKLDFFQVKLINYRFVTQPIECSLKAFLERSPNFTKIKGKQSHGVFIIPRFIEDEFAFFFIPSN